MSSRNIIRASGGGKPFWPQIHRVEKGQHPLHPEQACLIATIPDLLASESTQRQKLVDELHVAAQEGALLATEASEMRQHNWVVPQPGELVLARIEGDSSGGMRDTVIGLALESSSLNALFPGSAAQLQCIRDGLLGPREQRNGTAAIEKSPNSSHSGHQGPRCYTIGASIETGTHVIGPAANTRRGVEGSQDAYWKTLGQIVPTLADIHSRAIASALAPGDADLLARRGEYYNAPALGTTRHHLVAGMQVNVTSISGRSSKAHESLGTAGVFHTDDGDDFCSLSALTNLSDVGADIAHGFFLLLEYGIAFQWEPMLTILASGRALHVSSPPQLCTQRPDRQLEPWELRLLVISYPSLGVLTRTGPTLLSSSPSGPLVIPAHRFESDSTTSRLNRSWASDGGSLMGAENHLVFLARELLSLGQQMLDQVPGLGPHARIDPATFFRSIQVRATSLENITPEADPSVEEWIPAISEPNLLWSQGPWPSSIAGFAPAPPPDLSDMISRHQAGFIMLTAKSDGTLPSQAARVHSTKVKQMSGKRVPMTSGQRAIVRRLVNTQKTPNKRQLDLPGADSNRVLRKRKINDLTVSVVAGNSTTESDHEDLPSGSDTDDEDYTPFDSILQDSRLHWSSKTADQFPFIKSLATDALLSALSTAQSHQLNLRKGSFNQISSTSTTRRNHTRILQFSADLLSQTGITVDPNNYQPPTQDTLSGILDFWSAIDGQQSFVSHSWFMDRRLTASVMLATWRVWYWVEVVFRQLCASALVVRDEVTWAGQLAHDVYHHVLQRHTTTFQREKYLPLPEMSVQLTHRTFLSGVELLQETTNVAVQLMHRWMNFPPTTTDQSPQSFKASLHQSRFVHLLMSTTLNSDILLLPAIQDAWCRLPSAVFGKRGINGLPGETWDNLQWALVDSKLGEQNSSIAALVCAHATVCSKHPKPSTLAIPVLSPDDLEILSSTHMTLGSPLDLSEYWTEYQAFVPPSTEPAQACEPPPPIPTSSVVNSPYMRAATELKAFLCDFIPLSPGQQLPQSLSERQRKWLQLINKHTHGASGGQDFFNPLRELAPSRCRVTSNGGPFSLDFIRTPGGFFSALIFRAVTFTCSTFLQRPHNNRFASLAEWNSAVAAAKGDGLINEDICNKRAYGTAQRGRTLANVDAYWLAATTLWPPFLRIHGAEHDGTIPWIDGLAFLNRRMPQRQSLLPEMGPLTTYLLSVDLVYAGVFAPPTIAQFASAVWSLDSGARKGMLKLGIIPAEISESEFQTVFNELYCATTRLLTAEEFSRIGWDMFVLEHALCKAQRVGIV